MAALKLDEDNVDDGLPSSELRSANVNENVNIERCRGWSSPLSLLIH